MSQTSPHASTSSGAIARAASIIALGNISSRVLGLVRETVIATLFGASGLVSAFRILAEQQVGGVVVCGDAFFQRATSGIVVLAAHHAIPSIMAQRDFAEVGGLMAYGANLNDAHRQSGIYVGRILKGEKAGDLPVVQPAKFELVINLKTAKALNLTVPNTLLVAADEVIE